MAKERYNLRKQRQAEVGMELTAANMPTVCGGQRTLAFSYANDKGVYLENGWGVTISLTKNQASNFRLPIPPDATWYVKLAAEYRVVKEWHGRDVWLITTHTGEVVTLPFDSRWIGIKCVVEYEAGNQPYKPKPTQLHSSYTRTNASVLTSGPKRWHLASIALAVVVVLYFFA